MNGAVLGANHLLSGAAMLQAVTPPSSALSSGHLSAAPPQSASCRPSTSRYQAERRAPSPVDLKKTPPMPVIRAMRPSRVPAVTSTPGPRLDRHRLGSEPAQLAGGRLRSTEPGFGEPRNAALSAALAGRNRPAQ